MRRLIALTVANVARLDHGSAVWVILWWLGMLCLKQEILGGPERLCPGEGSLEGLGRICPEQEFLGGLVTIGPAQGCLEAT